MSDITYLFSSFKENPEFFFQGYCFIGNNYIYGFEGANSYMQETSNSVNPGQDGCYITVEKKGDNYLFGSDYSGYKKVLYFKDPITESWAVSNSLNLLVNHLRENSIEVTPNFSLINLMSQIETSTQQPISYNTIANEIKLLPLNTTLEIGNKVLIINKILIDNDKSYKELMVDFIEVWSSRFATLMTDGSLNITQALTGGLDSRAVFALSSLAKEHISDTVNANYKLICGLTKGETIDLDIAQTISDNYGYTLNDEKVKKASSIKLDNMERYKNWKDISLGLYRPVYFPDTAIDPYSISIGGGGGETYKPAYGNYMKPNNFDGLINNLIRKVGVTELEVQIENDLRNTLNQLNYINNSKDLDHLILHCVHFRTRFHAGLFPQYKVTFTPLSSSYLKHMSTNENIEKIKDSQVLYDLINLVDGLLGFPFDDIYKEPKVYNITNLLKIDRPINIEVGKVYIDDKALSKMEYNLENNSNQPLELLKEDFDSACQKKLVKSVWGNEFISKAESMLNLAISQGKFRYASDAGVVSAIISTSLF